MSALLDAYGSPVSTRLINGAERNSTARPPIPLRVEGIEKAVPLTDWQVILSVSRRLFANNGIIQGALTQKAMHAVGSAWQPVFLGMDKEWGKAATEWLEDEWFPVCNVRGETYDFRTSIYLSSINIDRDGDEAEILTETADGYPQIQTVPAHRIGQRGPWEKVVKTGQYAGLNICLGCITNAMGRTVAYRVLGELEKDDADVSARDIVFNFDPLYADQLRGFPIFSHALNDWRDADQSQYWEQLAQLIASSIGLIEQNETGVADPEDPSLSLGVITDGTRPMSTETLAGGMIRYFKAGTGSKLETFQSNRPGDLWDSFQDRIARKALAPVWPYAMSWKGGESSGTGERTILEYARKLVSDRQELLKPRAKRKVGYAISKAIKLGILPAYKGADKGGFLKWGFVMPAAMSIDHGRDGNGRREDYKLGHRNLATILAEQGINYAEHRTQRGQEVIDLMDQAKQISESTGQNFGLVLSLLEQRTATASVGGGVFGNALEDGSVVVPSPDDADMRAQLPQQHLTFNLPAPTPAVVNVRMPRQQMQAAPVVNVNVPQQETPPAPVVNVSVPRQASPVVNVSVPRQAAPVVNVAAPRVTVAAPRVSVAAPSVQVAAPVVHMAAAPAQPRAVMQRQKVTRNRDGIITGSDTTIEYSDE